MAFRASFCLATEFRRTHTIRPGWANSRPPGRVANSLASGKRAPSSGDVGETRPREGTAECHFVGFRVAREPQINGNGNNKFSCHLPEVGTSLDRCRLNSPVAGSPDGRALLARVTGTPFEATFRNTSVCRTEARTILRASCGIHLFWEKHPPRAHVFSLFWSEANLAMCVINKDIVEQNRDSADVHSLLPHHVPAYLAQHAGKALD